MHPDLELDFAELAIVGEGEAKNQGTKKRRLTSLLINKNRGRGGEG